MDIYWLNNEIVFPPVEKGSAEGLLAVGGDLSTERLLLAYQSGIFPWYEEPPILWFSPDPRYVLYPEKFKVAKSLRKVIAKEKFNITFNTSFKEVIQNCAERRKGETWIIPEMIEAYTKLHEAGHAFSVETWFEGELVGGLYGVVVGTVFCGESMFHKVTDASKVAFYYLVQELIKKGFTLIDAQLHNPHLETFGCEFIPLKAYQEILKTGLDK
ncbi:MAG: leucyl/phenylalanyl-tRNA--protein transferase [Leptospirales bacterium]